MTEQNPGGRAGALGPRASLDRVLEAAQRAGLRTRTARTNECMVTCPVHDEKTPSMHVTWASGQRGGFVLLHCFGCGSKAEDLVEALGLTLADLFDEPLPERDRVFARVGKSGDRRRAGHRRGKLGRLPPLIARQAAEPEPAHRFAEVERYSYADLDGRVVQEVVRQECAAEHERHKRFFQRFRLGDDWVDTQPPEFVPVLYRAGQVRDAVQAGRQVLLLEGEKDVHTAERCGLVATTNARGGAGFPDELVECLRGADVVVVLDRDATGWARGVSLHGKLSAVARSVRLKLPAVQDAKADFTDHVQANLPVADLIDVHVDEVATWNSLTAATAKHALLLQADAQARAHLERAAPAAGADPATQEQHRRKAWRWVMETELRQESLRELVDRVNGQALRVGTVWAGQAMQQAEELLAGGTAAARAVHDAAGVPVPPSLRPAPPGSAPAARGPSAAAADHAGGEGEPVKPGEGLGAAAPVFRVLGRQIVQWEPRGRHRPSEPDPQEQDGSFKVILSIVVKVTVREFLEVETEQDREHLELMGRASPGRPKVSGTRQLVAVRLTYPHPVTDEPMEVRVTADQWRDHSWLQSLPGPVDYDHRRAGLDTLQRAILAVSDDMADEVLYRSTGWRVDADKRWRFVHARGAISAEGHQDLEVALSGALQRYDLPDPIREPEQLRQEFLEHSAGMLERLPDRVAAPLLGQVYRAVLGHNPWVLTLVGPPGSYKTSVAAKVMHHFGEQWEHTKPASSMSGNGDTFNTLRFKLHNAKDCLYWADDFAPTRSWTEAQKHLEETGRLVHNQEERGRTARDGLSISDGTPPRASALFTSEVMPRPGSGAERMLVVPICRDDVSTELLFPLDRQRSRYGRALVLASFIQWLAVDLAARRAGYQQQAELYAAGLVTAGETVRLAAALSQMWIGWVAMTDFLHEVGAVSEDERNALLERVDAALRLAGQAAVDPDLPRTTGGRVRELLQFALRQGIGYVDDVRTGDCPPWPLAGRLGWRRQITDLDAAGHPTKRRNDRMGMRLGYVLHDPDPRERGRVLMCDSTQLEAVLKAASATQAEQLQIDRNTAMRALYDDQVLIADTCEGKVRFTTKCRIHVEERTGRMVTLHLDKVIGQDPDDEHDIDPPDGTPDPGDGGAAAPGDPGDAAGPGGAPNRPSWVDPHRLDDPQQAVEGSGTPPQEAPMVAPQFTSRPYTDRDGVTGWSEPVAGTDTAPCVLCGLRCGMVISGIRCHIPCWEASTATQRSPHTTPAPATPQPRTTPSGGRAPAVANEAAGAAVKEPASGSFQAAAAVVDTDGIWCSNGAFQPLPGPIGHVGDLVRLAQWLHLGTQVTKYRTAAGQIWVGDELARQLGIDVESITAAATADHDKVTREVTRAAAGVTDALRAGYSLGGRDKDALGRWTRVWKGTEQSVWVVLLAAMTRDGADVPLMGDDPDHATLARRIGLLASALGHPYQLSGSTTGLDLMTALRWKDRESFFARHEPVPPALSNVELDLSWSRKPTAAEADHEFVHAYDRSGSYLAGVAGLELGVGPATHHPDGTAFMPRMPGYWRIEIPDGGDWRLPNLLDPRGGNTGKVRWVTTPGLDFAVEQGHEPAILEAYTWTQRARILEPWYERIRDARTALDTDDPDCQVARDQLKAIYAPTIGMFGSQAHMAGRLGYAPERRHHIVAKARTNILRRVVKIGQDTDRWPVAIVADTVLYTSSDPDPVAAWPGQPEWLGRALGRYKVEATGRLADQVKYLTGGPYRGKDALMERDGGG